MIYRWLFACICVWSLIAGSVRNGAGEPIPAGQAETAFKLSRKNNEAGKPCFLLDGKPFFPIANWIGFAAAVEDLRRFKNDGFNMIVLSVDAGQTTTPHFHDLMLACRELRLPVVLDYAPGEFFGWVQRNPELCMKLPDGTAVGYPDFANPATRSAYRQRLETVITSIKNYSRNPIVAFSPIDAYDSCHIPDGEVHYAFTVPPHPPGTQTLPFGASALTQYRRYLQSRLGLSPADVGFERWEDVVLPRGQTQARNELHWRTWILYRRYYMTDFLQEIADLVRQQTGLPVAMTLDVNFSMDENWGTPPFEFAKPADFLILYYYQLGLEPRPRIQQLVEWVYSHCALQGKPMIGLLEVTSALTPATTAGDYLRGSLPYVSGFAMMDAVAGYQKVVSRYADFVRSVAGMKGGLLTAGPPKASLAILLGTRDIYVNERLSPVLQQLGIEYDILYDADLLQHPELLKKYKVLYLPGGQPQLARDDRVSALLAKAECVIDENAGDSMLHHLETLGRNLNLTRERIDPLKRLGERLDGTPPAVMEPAVFQKADSQALDGCWQVSAGRAFAEDGGIHIAKTDANASGVMLKRSLTGSFVVEWDMTAIKGSPRVTLLNDDRGAGAGEISAGQEDTGEIGVYINGSWQRLGRATAGKPVHYRLAVWPADGKDLIGISANALQAVFLTDRRDKRFLYLLWAWPAAEAQIKNLRLSPVQPARAAPPPRASP
ncbi:MAG: hypothetical protein NTY46_08470 [Candidatus Sumerlaeota bacterium]|nr:hypothetical protein [Candidatus Sumerlaeota bacterium]